MNTHTRTMNGETFEAWSLHGSLYRKTSCGTWAPMSDADIIASTPIGCSTVELPPPKEPTDPFEHPIVDGKAIDGPEHA